MIEFAILLDNQAIVGPDWRSEAEVMDSFHGFGVNRAYGQLVSRSPDNPDWRPVHGHLV